MKRLCTEYFHDNDALSVAEALLGKILVREFGNGKIIRSVITETEAYLGIEDKANHASKGRTRRTELMFGEGGTIYVYLIYGRYWLLNVVTGPKEEAQAVLIRGIKACSGPGRIGNLLELDRSFYGESITDSNRIWIEEPDQKSIGKIVESVRVGVDYAGEEWRNKPWRFMLETED